VSRRDFNNNILLKGATMGILAPLYTLFAGEQKVKTIDIAMNGELDDDLFVLSVNQKGFTFIDCLQMHNPSNVFTLDGISVKSEAINGNINYNKQLDIKVGDILFLATANEREENGLPRYELHSRTHYKSAPLFINELPFFPSMIPENGDYKDLDYPLYFQEGESGCLGDKQGNYFKLWENALINVGLVFTLEIDHTISLYRDSRLIASSIASPFDTLKTARLEDTDGKTYRLHPFVEIDNTLYGDDDCNDELIKNNAPNKIVLHSTYATYEIPLPYLFPYPERIFYEFI